MLIPHQANIRIIEAASKSLGLPMEKIFTNLEHYGNTSAASIPIAITEAVESGRLRPNDKVVAIGFGAGLTWAACALTWGQPRPVSRAQHVVVRAKIGIGGVRSRVKRGIRQAGERVTDALDPLLKRGERQAAREITPAKLEPVRKVDVPVPLPAARPAAPERPKIEDGPLNGKH